MKIEITPVVVVPDVSPLIHLAAANLLPLLQEFGRVVVMDMVAYEASADPNKPWASEIADWLTKGREPGGNEPVEIVKTEIGEAFRLARQADPAFKMRDAGERAIRDWLADALPELGGPVLIVYEDKKMPKLIQRERLDDVVVMATTRAILVFAEERGLIVSAEDIWNDIAKRAEGASPSLDVKVLRPAREP